MHVVRFTLQLDMSLFPFHFHHFQVGDLKKKLDAQNREEMKMLAKKHKDKAELNRIKREAQQKHIQMAVQERQKVNIYGIHFTILICQKACMRP